MDVDRRLTGPNDPPPLEWVHALRPVEPLGLDPPVSLRFLDNKYVKNRNKGYWWGRWGLSELPGWEGGGEGGGLKPLHRHGVGTFFGRC